MILAIAATAVDVSTAAVLLPSQQAVQEGQTPAFATPLQRAIIYRPDSSREVLLLQPGYCGPKANLCWVIPLPQKPQYHNIFTASQTFFDLVFAHTAPTTATQITFTSGQPHDARPPTVSGDHPSVAPVRCDDTIWLGRYRIQRPSRYYCRHLDRWLQRRGYAVPHRLEQILDHYAQKDWRFLVLQVDLPDEGSRLISKYMQPIGIRFDAQQAVLPLAIGRANNCEKTAVEAVVLAPVPVTCDGLPCVDVPERVQLGSSECYEAWKSRLSGNGLVREAIVMGALGFSDVYYDPGSWPRRHGWRPQGLWATRFSGRVPTRKLADLVFSDDGTAEPFHARINRQFQVQHEFTEARLTRIDTGAIMLTICIVAVALIWVFGLSADQSPQGPRGSAVGDAVKFAGRALIYIGAIIILYLSAMTALRHTSDMPILVRFLSGQLPLRITAQVAAVLVVWSIVGVYFAAQLRRACDGANWLFWLVAAAVGLPLVGAIIVVPPQGARETTNLAVTEALGVAQVAIVCSIAALAVLAGAIAQAAAAAATRGRLLAAEAGLLLGACVLCSPLLQLGSRDLSHTDRSLNDLTGAASEAVERVRAKIGRFRYDVGCLPSNLEALVRNSQVRRGLDHAGNDVVLAQPRAVDAYLSSLPENPLTNRHDAWMYCPLSVPMVAPLASAVTIGRAMSGVEAAPQMRTFWEMPRGSALRDALGPICDIVWSQGDYLLRATTISADDTLVRAVAVDDMYGAVVSFAQSRELTAPRLGIHELDRTLTLSFVISHSSLGLPADWPAMSAVFELAGAGDRLIPLSAPIQGRVVQLRPSPADMRVACLVRTDAYGRTAHSVRVLAADGHWDPPMLRGATDVQWAPSAGYLVAVRPHQPQNTGAKTSPAHELIRLDDSGELETITREPIHLGGPYIVTRRAVLFCDRDQRLQMLRLANGEISSPATGPGRVNDLVSLSAGYSAALIGAEDKGDDKAFRGKILVLDDRGNVGESIGPIAPSGMSWKHARIIGLHPTDYFFVHLWSEEPTEGAVVLVGRHGEPPQAIATVRD